MSDSTMIQITGLWLNETQDGQKYFTGYMGNARVLIFRNGYKKEDKHPDYILYVSENKPRDDDGEDAPARDDSIPF